MLVKPFASIIAKEKELATMSFLGTVEDNNDPEKLHRVKVHAAPYENLTTEQLPWALPKQSSCGNSPTNASFNVPEIGSQVRIFFPSQDLTAPYYEGAEFNETNRCTFFDEDYPNTYGYKDSKGNFMRVNKAKETIELQHSSTTNLKVAADGSAQVSLSNGSSFTFSNYDGFDFDVKGARISGNGLGELEIESKSQVDVHTSNLTINAPSIKLNGAVEITSGASGVIFTLGHILTVTNGIITSISGITNSSGAVNILEANEEAIIESNQRIKDEITKQVGNIPEFDVSAAQRAEDSTYLWGNS